MPRKPKAPRGAALGAQVGRNIRTARTQRGMTQGQLAEAIDIETATLSRIEIGAQLPSLDRLQHISEVLQVHLRSLVAEENTPSLFIESIAEALSGLPTREQVFLRDFVLSYSLHWKRGQTS
ncbi:MULTISPECIES: helix-turn-helix transcriptional regulator [Massilia]|uniref:helix-turn-helix domain-containing protein n=1 Tax=Massilia TaxID=149698 RepID=UPI0009533B5A